MTLLSRYRPHSRIRATATACLVATLASASATASAHADSAIPPQVKFEVGFSPDRPDAQTTVSLGFSVRARPTELVPPPLTRIEIWLPPGMGLGTTNLGESTCTEATLTTSGVAGCPADAFMGLGQAMVETAVAGEIIREHLQIAILMAPAEHEHTTILYQTEGLSPVSSEIIFPGELLDATPPYGARVVTSVPLVSAWAEGPYVALTHVLTTIGPQGLTYYKRLNGKRVAYSPHGMVVPAVCPRGGYPFAARLTFLESAAYIKGAVRCGGQRGRRSVRAHMKHRH